VEHKKMKQTDTPRTDAASFSSRDEIEQLKKNQK